MKELKVYHPLLFPIYYVLFLYAYNVTEATVGDIPLPLGLLFALSILFWIVMWVVPKDIRLAGILTTIMLFLFVSYGHIYTILERIDLWGINPGRHRFMFPLWMLTFAVVAVVMYRLKDRLGGVNRFLNMTLTVLIALSIFNIALGHLRIKSSTSGASSAMSTTVGTSGFTHGKPDIYYIILDGYASERTLNDLYELDNSPFLDSLRNLGFYIADNSFSNYAHTPLSLSSSLNMDYMDYVIELSGAEAKHHTLPFKLIREAEVVRFLKEAGYKYVLMRSGFAATDRSPLADISIKCGRYNEFIKVLINTTMLKIISKHLVFLDWHRETVQGMLDKLKGDVPAIDGPKFVMAHVLIPHAPYLFGADGEAIDTDNLLLGANLWLPRSGYVDQMMFLNGQVLSIVHSIQAASPDAIILIQGDHGPGSMDEWSDPSDEFLLERMTILNAMHLPEVADSLLYDGISPVNSFRLILNRCFGADLDLIEDRSYFSPVTKPYTLTDVTERLGNAIDRRNQPE